MIWPIYRHGRSAITRMPDMAMKQLFGSEDNLHVAREGTMSSDAIYLAARMKAAAARGELDRLTINPALRARRAEFEREQKELMEGMPRFLGATIVKLKGQRVWLSGTWNILHTMAKSALAKGLEGVFSPDSLVTTGGGAKGRWCAQRLVSLGYAAQRSPRCPAALCWLVRAAASGARQCRLRSR